ncbi:MAG: hypothetical protein P8Y78_10490, partial [Acidihalobacter sp.]
MSSITQYIHGVKDLARFSAQIDRPAGLTDERRASLCCVDDDRVMQVSHGSLPQAIRLMVAVARITDVRLRYRHGPASPVAIS